MSRYRRGLASGGTFFFTVNLADRKGRLLVDEFDRLRKAFDPTRERYPFKMLAYCILPEHLHAIWQRRFWEHQIRDDVDLQRHVDYIHFNPVKHGLAPRVADWPYSSFHRYVERGLLAPDWADGDAKQNGGLFGE